MYTRAIAALLVAAVSIAIAAALWVSLTYSNDQTQIALSFASRPEQSCAEVGYEGATCDQWQASTQQGRKTAEGVATTVGGAGSAARTGKGALAFASGHGLGLAGLVLVAGLGALTLGGERAAGVDHLRSALRTRSGIATRFAALSTAGFVAVLSSAVVVFAMARIHPWDLNIPADYRSSSTFAARRLFAVICWIGLNSVMVVSIFMRLRSRTSAFLGALGSGAALIGLSELPGIGSWTPYGLIRSISLFRFEQAYFDSFLPFESTASTTSTGVLVVALASQIVAIWVAGMFVLQRYV